MKDLNGANGTNGAFALTHGTTAALKDLLFRIADDALIIGHRTSEWTGFGPILEEDIAFSSMAQNEIGQAQSYYTLLHEWGEADPDTLAFLRFPREYKNAIFVELPIGDYAFSLARHFLYDFAKEARLRSLVKCAYKPLANLALKIQREQKYHLMHAKAMVVRLGNGTEESRLRMQSAFNEAYPAAWGLFEATDAEQTLAEHNLQEPENVIASVWLELIEPILAEAKITLPDANTFDPKAHYGGRKGYHTDALDALVDEMTAVIRLDPAAAW